MRVCNLVFKRHTLIRSKIKALIDKYLDNRATPGEADLLHHWLDILGEEAMPGKAADAGSREQLRRKMLKVIRQRAGRPAGIYPIWKKMAAAAGLPCTPHAANLSLVTMCTMHLLGAIPNAGKYLEFSIEGEDYYPWQDGLFLGDPYRIDGGKATIPDAPGWGIEINPAWLDAATYQVSEFER